VRACPFREVSAGKWAGFFAFHLMGIEPGFYSYQLWLAKDASGVRGRGAAVAGMPVAPKMLMRGAH
jgi:hypothetical protein